MKQFQAAFVNSDHYREYIRFQYGTNPPRVSRTQACRTLLEAVSIARQLKGFSFIQDPTQPAHWQ